VSKSDSTKLLAKAPTHRNACICTEENEIEMAATIAKRANYLGAPAENDVRRNADSLA
jgi:hypothetical protein